MRPRDVGVTLPHSVTLSGYTIMVSYNIFDDALNNDTAVDNPDGLIVPPTEREMYRQFGRMSLSVYMAIGFVFLSNLLIAIQVYRYRFVMVRRSGMG